MIGTINTVVNTEPILMHLWRHECTRVMADRYDLVQSDRMVNFCFHTFHPFYSSVNSSNNTHTTFDLPFRFISDADKEWFDIELLNLVEREFNEEVVEVRVYVF